MTSQMRKSQTLFTSTPSSVECMLVGMGKCANQASIEAENTILGPDVHAGTTKIVPSYCSAKQAGTIHQIRTACSVIQKHGSQQASVYPIFTQNFIPKGWITYLWPHSVATAST